LTPGTSVKARKQATLTVFAKNLADTGTFNRTSGTGALAGTDIYDTIDDNNANQSNIADQTPTTNGSTLVVGWNGASGGNWLRDSVSDYGNILGLMYDNNGDCDSDEDCVMIDRFSDLMWAKTDATTRTLDAAITHCEGLNFGDRTDWRVPSQKEMLQAYVDGITSQKSTLNFSSAFYHSSTAHSLTTANSIRVNVATGESVSATRATTARSICVRP